MGIWMPGQETDGGNGRRRIIKISGERLNTPELVSRPPGSATASTRLEILWSGTTNREYSLDAQMARRKKLLLMRVQ
jgi:hypothetical protein